MDFSGGPEIYQGLDEQLAGLDIGILSKTYLHIKLAIKLSTTGVYL